MQIYYKKYLVNLIFDLLPAAGFKALSGRRIIFEVEHVVALEATLLLACYSIPRKGIE